MLSIIVIFHIPEKHGLLMWIFAERPHRPPANNVAFFQHLFSIRTDSRSGVAKGHQ